MKFYRVATLGCKANSYDSQLLEAELQRRGWAPAAKTGGTVDLCIVNSCTVTDEADRQTRKMASRLFRDHPGARIVITGCAAEVDPERMAASPGVHYVIGNRDKPAMVELILKALAQPLAAQGAPGAVLGTAQRYEELLSRHPMDREWPLPEASFVAPPVLLEGNSGKTRAFLKIQEGCNSFCTYCIIPYGRGPSRSLRPEEVVAQTRQLVERGVREVVITGTNVGDYGSDWGDGPTALTELFRRILSETAIERLRVSSLDPVEISSGLLELMRSDSRFCAHFHVSLQSPDSRILKLMKRKYGFSDVRECLDSIARLPAPLGGVFVGMDVITGFPGESATDFENTVTALRSLPWSRLHVFPYSERDGTPATRLPGAVSQAERVARAQRLNQLSLERLKAIHEGVLGQARDSGSPVSGILLEKPVRMDGQLRAAGYTSNYLRVILEDAATDFSRNALVDALPIALRIDAASGDVALLASAVR